MYNLRRSVRAVTHHLPVLPELSGDVFVFGAAPDPVVPKTLLTTASIVTANASQVYLEQFGVTKPDITFMRSNMYDGKPTSAMKLKKLEGRKTGLLILLSHKKDPECLAQRALLGDVGYHYDDYVILSRLDTSMLHHRLLMPRLPFLIWEYRPSMGVQAILVTLAMGATRVAVTGISFRSTGCSYSKLDYERVRVTGDLTSIRQIQKSNLPVYAVDEALAEDTGLAHWA